MQNIIAEHEIRNISCAAQDPEDLCTFAYITKDLQTSHHYCHVFSTVDVVKDTLHILFFFSYIDNIDSNVCIGIDRYPCHEFDAVYWYLDIVFGFAKKNWNVNLKKMQWSANEQFFTQTN